MSSDGSARVGGAVSGGARDPDRDLPLEVLL
jgi:hypothetical protein